MATQQNEEFNGISDLLQMAENKSAEHRQFLYQRIGNFLVSDSHNFSDAEKELMVDIICKITGDVEKSIRAHFAKRLSTQPDAPNDLLVFLANDDADVALPILRDCGLLSEPDLLEIVKNRSLQHKFAIAARENIGEKICLAINEIGDRDLTVVMLENHSAQIPEFVLEQLGDMSEYIKEFQKPLLRRPFLPKPVAEKMYRWVSVALREYITEKFEIDPRSLDVDIECREKTINAISADSDPSSQLVEKLHSAGELTTGFMIKSLRQGEIDLFEHAFAKLLGRSVNQIRSILYADNPEILAIACRVINLDRAIFKLIHELSQSVQDKEDTILSPAISAPMELYDLLSTEAAEKALGNEDFMSGSIKYADTA